MLFGVDLVKAGLAETIIAMLKEMLAGSSAVRNTLIAYLGQGQSHKDDDV